MVLETRERLAFLFNVADSSRLVFTANVTEALNLALKGLLVAGDHTVITSMEHNAVVRPLWGLKEKGVEVTVVNCSPQGCLDPQDVKRALRPNTRLVCVNHASNVVGTIQPVEEVGKIAAEHGALFLVDCAQTAGVLPLDVQKMHIDLLAFTGHKGLLGPPGTGGLYIREGIDLRPLKEGGTGSHSEMLQQPEEMPDRYESGTLNTAGLAGLGAGVKFILNEGREKIREHEKRLAAQILEGLRGIRGVLIYGPQQPEEMTAVISFNLEDQEANQVSFALDRVFNIATRAGLHCAPLAHRTIGTLETGTVRVSPGYFNTAEEVDRFLSAVHYLALHGSC